MLLGTFRQPRRLMAFGSVSKEVVAWQGNIAGCGHANSLLLVLTLRTLRRANAIAPTVTPRGLVDDVTLDWKGPQGDIGGDLVRALGIMHSSMRELKVVLQPEKSGYLASSRRRARLLGEEPRPRAARAEGPPHAGEEEDDRHAGEEAAAGHAPQGS